MNCSATRLHGHYSPVTLRSATSRALYLSLVLAILLPNACVAQTLLLQALAEQGDPVAQLSLGKMYAVGQDVPRDLVTAHAWLSRSAARGNEEAAKLRDDIEAQMTPEEVARAQQLAEHSKPAALGEAARTSEAREPSRELIAEIQRRLTDLGYAPGPVDGLTGEKTRRAVMAFQSDAGLAPDGELTPGLREQLAMTEEKRSAAAPPPTAVSTRWASPRRGTIRAETELRSSPGDSAPSLRRLPAGSAVRVVGSQGQWYEVEVASSAEAGWVKLAGVSLFTTAQDDAAGETKEAASATQGFFSNLARGLTGLVGSAPEQPVATGSVTPTIGIRGLTSGDLLGARANPRELEKLDRFVASDVEATRFAGETPLVRNSVQYLPEPVGVPSGTGGERGGAQK